jgi:hypothetical protein
MRYGLAQLMLALPFSAVYRPATDTPRAREVRRRAYYDRDAGIGIADWPKEDKEELYGDFDTMRVYRIARHPERIDAPPAWPAEIALLASGTVLATLSDESFTWRGLWRYLAVWPAWRLHTRARRVARRRRVEQLGVTVATAPEAKISPHAWTWMLLFPLLVWLTWRERHVRRSHWEMWLATQIVRALNERRSYDAALRRP